MRLHGAASTGRHLGCKGQTKSCGRQVEAATRAVASKRTRYFFRAQPSLALLNQLERTEVALPRHRPVESIRRDKG